MPDKLIIEGMHCEACRQLIGLEIEEAGFGKDVMSINLIGDNKGELILADVSAERQAAIKVVINRMDSYSV